MWNADDVKARSISKSIPGMFSRFINILRILWSGICNKYKSSIALVKLSRNVTSSGPFNPITSVDGVVLIKSFKVFKDSAFCKFSEYSISLDPLLNPISRSGSKLLPYFFSKIGITLLTKASRCSGDSNI